MKLGSKFSLVRKLLESKKFRDSYVYEHVRNSVPFQIRALRDERRWTQGRLGEVAGKPRNVVTRLEDPNYGKLTLKTLFEIASAFDVALLVKLVPFSRLLHEYEDVSPVALSAKSIADEARQLERWAGVMDSATDPEPPLSLEVRMSNIPSTSPKRFEVIENKKPVQKSLLRTPLKAVTQADRRLEPGATTSPSLVSVR